MARTKEQIEISLADLISKLADTAIQRDKAGGHATIERQFIRDSGLLRLSVPVEYGGDGATWPQIYKVVRKIAAVDSALAHVFAFHHLQIATIQLYGSSAQQKSILKQTIDDGVFWGNALNPNDKRAVATRSPGGFIIHGPKSFCSGSVGSDYLTFSAWNEDAQSLVFGYVPSNRAGVEIEGDWDSFGQKQTDSGTVQFHSVFVSDAEILISPGQVLKPQQTVRAILAQHVLTTLYLGISQGAFDAAIKYINTRTRPYFQSNVSSASEDPYIQHQIGNISAQLAASTALADLAEEAICAAFEKGPDIEADQRGEVAILVAQAKVNAHNTVINLTSKIFEQIGASATSDKYGFDRYWRNARVHTLHDPIDYKIRDIGRFAVCHMVPLPTSYS